MVQKSRRKWRGMKGGRGPTRKRYLKDPYTTAKDTVIIPTCTSWNNRKKVKESDLEGGDVNPIDFFPLDRYLANTITSVNCTHYHKNKENNLSEFVNTFAPLGYF